MGKREKKQNTENLTALETEIEITQRALATIRPPEKKGGQTPMVLERTEHLLEKVQILRIKEESDWNKKKNIYQEVLSELATIKGEYNDAAGKIIRGNFTELQREEFATVTRRYQRALEVVNECQLDMARSLRDRTFGRMGSDGLDKEIKVPKYNAILNLPGFTIQKVNGYQPPLLDLSYN